MENTTPLLNSLEDEPIFIDLRPVELNVKESIITAWELRIYFNTRTQTITHLTNDELNELHAATQEAIENITNPDYASTFFKSKDGD